MFNEHSDSDGRLPAVPASRNDRRRACEGDWRQGDGLLRGPAATPIVYRNLLPVYSDDEILTVAADTKPAAAAKTAAAGHK